MYKFWGFPIGVSILPRLAANVSMTITKISFFRPVWARVSMVNGIKTIKATSLVTNIEETNTMFTNKMEKYFTLLVLASILLDKKSNIPSFLKPAVTTIRQNKIARTDQSICEINRTQGGAKYMDAKASRATTKSTNSLFINEVTLVIMIIL